MMHTIFIPLRIRRAMNNQVNFQSDEFDFEYQCDEKEENILRKIAQSIIPVIREKKLTNAQLQEYMSFPAEIYGGTLILPIRIADLVDSRVEKFTITLPAKLVEDIDRKVASSPEYKSRSSFLADAAVSLLLEEKFEFDNTDAPKGRETKEL